MKKIFMLVFLYALFTSFAYAEVKIGFVKIDQIIKEAPQSAQSNKKLESEFKTRTEKLKKQISELNTEEKNYQKNSLTMSDAEKEKFQKRLQQDRIEIQRAERELREDIDLRRREEVSKLQDKVTKVIDIIANKEKFDLILYTGVAYASDKIDITANVLKELGNLK